MSQNDNEVMVRQTALHHAMHLADIQGTHNDKIVNSDDVVSDAEKFLEFLNNTTGLRSV